MRCGKASGMITIVYTGSLLQAGKDGGFFNERQSRTLQGKQHKLSRASKSIERPVHFVYSFPRKCVIVPPTPQPAAYHSLHSMAIKDTKVCDGFGASGGKVSKMRRLCIEILYHETGNESDESIPRASKLLGRPSPFFPTNESSAQFSPCSQSLSSLAANTAPQ